MYSFRRPPYYSPKTFQNSQNSPQICSHFPQLLKCRSVSGGSQGSVVKKSSFPSTTYNQGTSFFIKDFFLLWPKQITFIIENYRFLKRKFKPPIIPINKHISVFLLMPIFSLFIFIFGCAGSSLLCRLFFLYGVRAFHCGGFSCGAQAVGQYFSAWAQ